MSDSTDSTEGSPAKTTDESDPGRVLLRTQVGRELAGQDAFGSVCVLSTEQARRTLSDDRKEIIRVLHEHNKATVAELSEYLDRHIDDIQTDLDELATGGLVDFEQKGSTRQATLSHDTIIIEPLVAPTITGDTSYTVQDEPK
jgi:predicted transcriptional regulator